MITFDLNTYILNTTDYGGKYILYEVGSSGRIVHDNRYNNQMNTCVKNTINT